MTVEQVKNIWEKYPKSIEKLVEWYKSQMPKPIGKPEIDIPMQEAFKNAEKALQISMASTTPRFLYEFFDENNIYPVTGRWKDKWVYTFGKQGQGLETGEGEDRQEAENYSFMEAFSFLEKQLND